MPVKIIIFIFLCLTALTGCNTVAGLGQDIEKAGEKINDMAKD